MNSIYAVVYSKLISAILECNWCVESLVVWLSVNCEFLALENSSDTIGLKTEILRILTSKALLQS